MKKLLTTSIAIYALLLLNVANTHAHSAKALLDQTANAMGGMNALRALKNEIVESEGKQFDSSSKPSAAARAF